MYTAKLDIKHQVNAGLVVGVRTARIASITLRADSLEGLSSLVAHMMGAVEVSENALRSNRATTA